MLRLGRYGIWLLACLLLLGTIHLCGSGLKQLLLTRNPHFALKHIEVTVRGQMSPREVVAILGGHQVRIGKTNLFELDPAFLRQALCRYVLISNANVRLKLPDTLRVEVFERVPVARFLSRGVLDREGWLLPQRDEGRRLDLPAIIGARGVEKCPTGTRLQDDMIAGALHLLHLMSVRPYGRYFDISAVQLDYERNALRLHLRTRGIFRENAQILVPAKPPMELEESLSRVELITRERSRGQQVTGFIDATYRVNVPVLP